MARLNRATAVAIIGLAGAGWPESARAQHLLASVRATAVRTTAPAPISTVGAISGTVSDDRGGPLAGAMVSVYGETMAMDTTDADGRFLLERLPMGKYVLRAHRAGFTMSGSQTVLLGSHVPAVLRLQLRRLEAAIGTSGAATLPLPARTIIAAGVELPRLDVPDTAKPAGQATTDDHPHNETAWRLRHLPRSILKDSASTIVLLDDETAIPSGSLFGRAMVSAASVATSLFTDPPFSGEVNFLTTSAFGSESLFSDNSLPRGVAYLSIGAPTPAGDWAVRAAMSEGDLSSWLVAGSFMSHRGALHSYDIGVSYSAQEYQGGNPLALAAVTDGSRNVGEVSAIQRWSTPGVSFEYGGRYARYDYLSQSGLLSPRAGLTLEPVDGTRVVASVAQRMVAPGAEEFLSQQAPGPWLPPERTFSSLGGGELRVERARTIDVLLEHEFDQRYVVGIRRFFQAVDNQLATFFGLDVPGGTRSVGHYYVTSTGSVQADGWGLRLASAPSQRIRASVDYSLARAQWNGRSGGVDTNGLWVPAAVRPDREDIHDITTSFETDIEETATRVFVLYKVNSAYTRGGADRTRPGFDGRFDVQVNQALPFALGGTRWELLVGLRNLFRDPNDPASVYDELLVVRPPKRVVGGFLVRF